MGRRRRNRKRNRKNKLKKKETMYPRIHEYPKAISGRVDEAPATVETTSKEEEVEYMDLGDSELDVKIEIDAMVFHKIMHWINKSEYEVSGLGKVVVDKEKNVIRVIDAILLPQENTSTTTDIDPAAVGKAMFLLKYTPGELRWWWHSHVNMQAFWSGTDTGTIKELSKAGWFCATVFNKRNEMRSAYSQFSPVHVMVDKLTTKIVQHIADDTLKDWDKSYEENVTNKMKSI